MNTALALDHTFPSQRLVDWFLKNRKLHSFRLDRTPYKVWVAEVILQQTRMNYALPRLENFLRIFPDLKSLAAADESDVLIAFKGLGYYNRARNLHQGAKYIQTKFKGVLPTSYEALLSIPSIGSYTAAAISSICFGEKKPAIDGNVKRIFARLCLVEQEIQTSKFQKLCEEYFDRVFRESKELPGPMNEALMELGQTFCLSKNPNCRPCPLHEHCLAFSEQKTQIFPKKSSKADKKEVIWLIFIMRHSNQILLQKTSENYFLKNQWTLPSVLNIKHENMILSFHQMLPDHIRQELHRVGDHLFREKIYMEKSSIKHTITTHKINIYTHILNISERIPEAEGLKWHPETQISHHLPSRAMQKAVMHLEAVPFHPRPVQA